MTAGSGQQGPAVAADTPSSPCPHRSGRKQGHGVEVEIDSIAAALRPTRVLRLSLDLLWGHLPPHMETDAVTSAFWEIEDHLREEELKHLRRYARSRDYFIVTPISPLNPPGPGDMERIAAAIRTLDDLGLIITWP